MKPRRPRPPAPARCKHPLLKQILRAQGEGCQVEHWICPDCKIEWMIGVYLLNGKHPMAGYNYAPVAL